MNFACYRFFILTFFFFSLPESFALAQLPFNEYNQSYNYNPNALTNFRHFVFRDEEGYKVILNIKYRSQENVVDECRLTYFFVNSYNSLDKSGATGVNYDNFKKRDGENNYFIIPLSPKVDTKDIMILKMATNNGDFVFYHDIPLYDAVDFIPQDGEEPFWAVTANYIPLTALNVKATGAEQKVTIRYWEHKFLPALPPMSKASSPKELHYTDTSFNSGTIIPIDKTGTYFVSTQPESKKGWVFRKEGTYFPEIKEMNELGPPLRYISTNEEYQDLLTHSDLRQAFEQFWLENSRSPKRARATIKRYYGQVTNANILFTTYKQGWKTDRGMVYIVFGKPDQVYRDQSEEIWIYGKDELEQVKFTFNKNQDFYHKGFYLLKRSKKYQDSWYRQVDLWRKGLKGI
ncbi:GWxTD domain-containing protein [Persicobacter sp. CCB-QB2]|uniref:GWxTD domain-containing protein n=1 Tax=Persicobacter sp. CCB-QB2 TaxID=1561025 RepID=UPI0006A99D7D|nr:GWxTD domain-containing protein [Persicobacter sp. CCB-QB2]